MNRHHTMTRLIALLTLLTSLTVQAAPIAPAPYAAPAAAPAPAARPAQANEFLGVVYPINDLYLSVRVAGVVQSLSAKVGQAVTAGQTLFQLDSQLQSIEVARRRAILGDRSELQTIEERLKILDRLTADATKLYEQAGSISREELMKLRIEQVTTAGRREQIKAAKQREQIESQLAEQEQQMRKLVAPVKGVVTELKVSMGEWANPGEKVVRLVDASTCEIRVSVSQAAARRVSLGKKIAIQIDDPAISVPVTGIVTFISPVVDPGSSLVEIRATFDNPDWKVRPGVKGRVRGDAL